MTRNEVIGKLSFGKANPIWKMFVKNCNFTWDACEENSIERPENTGKNNARRVLVAEPPEHFELSFKMYDYAIVP